jgi:O-acetyl-ADP-ribose deacetylase (regulator of RNase III)
MRVILVDINAEMVRAWRAVFAAEPAVQIVHGSLLDQHADAWVTPTNSAGQMNGGLDGVLKRHFGPRIEKAVQAEIARLYEGGMPVGSATCVRTGVENPTFLISVPTMVKPTEDIRGTQNVALACAAAFQAVHQQNARQPGGITSIALPGLGASTGKVPVRSCANLMWSAYSLFRDIAFQNFTRMRSALKGQMDGHDAETPLRYTFDIADQNPA